MSDVCNVAISGDYGVGKSSIVSSFRKCLFAKVRRTRVVSLLTLSERAKDNSSLQDDKTVQQSKAAIRKNIQQEIFRQLYYGERPGLLRLSRYSRIGKFPVLIYGVLIIVASSLLYAIMLQLGVVFTWTNSGECLVILCICLSLASFVHLLAMRIERFIQNVSHMNVGAGGFSLNLAKKSPDFEKAADEFVYYFKKTGCRILVLEDLDRFGDPCIYEELRQLNKLINGAKHIHGSVVFVYALKDSLISAPEARTKLFDAILPVIPFLTQDNALQKASGLFQQSGFTGPDVTEVCKVLVQYTKDMRTMKAICNTATIMREVIGGENVGLRSAEIIAIAMMREMEPLQYEDLRKGESYLDDLYAECLESKKQNAATLMKKVKDRGCIPDTLIESAQKDLWGIIAQPLASDKSYIIDYVQRDSIAFAKESADEEFWSDFIKNGSVNFEITYKHASYSYYPCKQQTKVISIETAGEASENIGGLIKLLLHDVNYYSSELEELLQRDALQSAKDTKSWDTISAGVIKDLISTGAIDESYRLYLSPLSDMHGSVELRSFRVQHLSNRTADYDFKLSDSDVEALLNEASQTDLQSPAFHNHYIIKWLVEHNDERLDVILRKNYSAIGELLEFFDWECCAHEKTLNEEYGDTIDGSIIMKGSLSTYVESDYTLLLTQKLAMAYPKELLILLSSTTNLRDTAGKEAIYIIAVTSLVEPAEIKFSPEEKEVIGSFLDYYEDTIILNGGGVNLAELRVANNLPTKRLDLYRNDDNAINILTSNMEFVINESSLKEISSDTVIQKFEKDGPTDEALKSIAENRGDDLKLITYCFERPDICEHLANQALRAKFIQLACRHKIGLQKEQLLNLTSVLPDENIIDIMLISNVSWADCEEIFASLHEPYNNIQLGKRPLLPNTTRSRLLVKKLKEFSVISRESTEEDSATLRLIMKRKL